MSKRKDNEVICTGGMPPQMADIMEGYNTYIKYVTAMWYAWTAVSGWKYYQDQYQAMLARMTQAQGQE